ncbi:MAG: BrnT family toxin [Candidatus Shapirobacteria bacterium]|jgi:hypothetical protein
MLTIPKPIKFIWDQGNINKNWQKHSVGNSEAEEVFFDPNKKIQKDILHSQKEKRFILLGQTKKKRVLFIFFTIRKEKIRIISARDIGRKSTKIYDQKT